MVVPERGHTGPLARGALSARSRIDAAEVLKLLQVVYLARRSRLGDADLGDGEPVDLRESGKETGC